MSVLEFWYDFASTYSYPAAMRIERETQARGIALLWRPFLLGPLFKAQGWTDSPFNLYPAKGRYMWRDLARICERDGVPLVTPARFPQNSLKAARLALIGEDAPWIADFTRAVYAANFAEQQDIADDVVLAGILSGLGLDAEAITREANGEANKQRLKDRSEAAAQRGLFGAPSFFVGDELFWGNDRLDDALDWASRER